ncbi:MAG: tetraacyldisaccharide 4'-kinase [Thermodesulfovibrionales bacterium]|nr:tetraacyldisaccharide 4'-kinase [Thermodesulfovibrionales bacterium]
MQFLYYASYKLHRAFKQKNSKKLPCKVISIGNITTGGTGKTPTVISIAEEAKKRDLYPIILTRGYKGKIKNPCIVNAGNWKMPTTLSTCNNVYECGDEPYFMAYRLKDVPIIKCPDRYIGGLFALRNLEYLCGNQTINQNKIIFILDDGFQHWQLQRDLDIVLIDGINPFGNKKLLPLGNLREPLSELKRADMVVITKKDNEKARKIIKSFNQSSPIFQGLMRPTKFVDTQGNFVSLDNINEKKVLIFSGLGNNQSFLDTINGLSPKEVFTIFFRDHHKYTKSDLDKIFKEASKLMADFIITTEKDMVKIKALQIFFKIYALQVDMVLDKEFFTKLFENLQYRS